MEFRKHLQEQKAESAESGRGCLDVDSAKVQINSLLFALLPPETTIADLDDLACALLLTIEGAWNGPSKPI